MTPNEIKAELLTIKKMLPRNASVGASIYEFRGDDCAHVYAYPSGAASKPCLSADAETWDSAFEDLRAKIIAWQVESELAIVRRMALMIIDITSQASQCDEAALIKAGFSPGEIAKHGDATCAKASEMAGNAPFSITRAESAEAAE